MLACLLMNRCLVTFALCLLTVLGPHAGTAETVILRGGVEITAPVLKQDSDVVVLDLGHTALSIPAAQVLSIETASDRGAGPAADSAGLYTSRRLEHLQTSEAAKQFSPAVLVVRSPSGQGSGFLVNKKGFLITNFHVIRGQKRISVTRFIERDGVLQRKTYEDVDIVAVDPFHDLAVLKIQESEDDPPLPRTVLAPEGATRFGETIFVIGNPLGLERTVTKGIVSQVARNFAGRLFLQVDAPVNPGNSGGPLFNERGEVIGVINMGIPVMEGLNFAIPIRHVKFLLDHLDAYAYDEANPESGFVYPDPPPKSAAGVETE